MRQLRRGQRNGSTIVLASPGPVQPGGNPFIRLLYSSLDSDIKVVDFTWVKAIFGPRYDVLHLHWPEYVIRTPSRIQYLVKLFLMACLPTILRIRGAQSVWTVHNLSPHEDGGGFEKTVLSAWSRSVAIRIYLTSVGCESDSRAIIIPHGDYSPIVDDVLMHSTDVDSIEGRVLVFGVLRPVKGLEDVVDIVSPTLDSRYVIRIVGEPVSAEFGALLKEVVNSAAGMESRFEKLSDAELISEIRGSSLVLLPYRKLYNSGALLLSLSCGRPVVAPETPTTVQIQDEVGPEWLQLYDPLDPASMVGAILNLDAMQRQEFPAFIGRSWGEIGPRYSAVYRGL